MLIMGIKFLKLDLDCHPNIKATLSYILHVAHDQTRNNIKLTWKMKHLFHVKEEY